MIEMPDGTIVDNFSIEEFECPCCKKADMDEEFLIRLDEARDFVETKFIINSGYRCKKHNKKVKGSSTSSHLSGLAADIRVRNSRERYDILYGLLCAAMPRIGVGKNFIHVDNDRKKDKYVIWHYYK